MGTILGSFLYAGALRVPIKKPWGNARSECDNCKHILNWTDLFPIFSFIFRKGRCFYCKKSIGVGHFIAEIITGLFVFSLFVRNYDIILSQNNILTFAFVILFSSIFFLIAVADLKYFIIPDKFLIALLFSALLLKVLIKLNYFTPTLYVLESIKSSFISSIWSALFIGLIFFIPWFLSKGKWLGLGDVKFMFVIGFLFGFPGSFLIPYLSIIPGAIVGVFIILLKKGNGKTMLPFGFFLSASSIFYLLFSSQLNSFLARILL